MENKKRNVDFVEDGFSSRLKRVCDTFYAGKVGEFASSCGIEISNMSTYINGKKRPKIDIIRIIKTLPQINARWMLFGDGDMLENNSSVKQIGESVNTPSNVGVEKSSSNITEVLFEQIKQKDILIERQQCQITKLIDFLTNK